MSASWATFEAADPAMATAGRDLLYQGGPIASAFLATAAGGGPRLHPVSPVLAEGELWLFVVDMSLKYRDLVANGRYALHAMLPPGGGREFSLQGRAVAEPSAEVRERVVAATGGAQGVHAFEALFRCGIDSALLTAWEGWGTAAAWPSYAKWRA
jgi:hypothetical protein